jgi:UTP--glucose-1-phosphate uridylyltransferase
MVACGRLPVIGYVLNELRDAGITDLLLISREGKESLESYVYSCWPGAYVVRQTEQQGLGDAIRFARGWAGDESFAVALGDTIIHTASAEPPLARLVRGLPGADASVVLVRRVRPELISRYGIVEPARPFSGSEASGELFPLRDIIEKPEPQKAPSDIAIAGRYIFAPALFPALEETLPAHGGEIQLTDAMGRLCSSPGGMFASLLREGERRFDIGNFDSYYEAFSVLSQSP